MNNNGWPFPLVPAVCAVVYCLAALLLAGCGGIAENPVEAHVNKAVRDHLQTRLPRTTKYDAQTSALLRQTIVTQGWYHHKEPDSPFYPAWQFRMFNGKGLEHIMPTGPDAEFYDFGEVIDTWWDRYGPDPEHDRYAVAAVYPLPPRHCDVSIASELWREECKQANLVGLVSFQIVYYKSEHTPQ